MMEFGQIPWWKCWKSNWVLSETMVTFSNCLLILGGNYLVDSVESLVLTVNRKHECYYKFLIFLIEVELLGQPTRN